MSGFQRQTLMPAARAAAPALPDPHLQATREAREKAVNWQCPPMPQPDPHLAAYVAYHGAKQAGLLPVGPVVEVEAATPESKPSRKRRKEVSE